MRVLLATPPMTQLNTPYPATAYLTGFLRARGIDARQADPALELVLRLLSERGVGELAEVARGVPVKKRTPAVRWFLEDAGRCQSVVDAAVRFLQGRDSTLAIRIASGELLPQGPRFAQAMENFGGCSDGHDHAAGGCGDPLEWAFGAIGVQDRAKYLATLFLDDLADVIRDADDPRFAFTRYGEKLAASAPSFEPLRQALESKAPTWVDRTLDELAEQLIREHSPELLCLSVPFPGNLYGALRIARVARRVRPECRVALGGGYVNTELRALTDPALFDYVDYVTLDDGERPLLCLIEHLRGERPRARLKRTFVKEGRTEGERTHAFVRLIDGAPEHDIPHRDAGTPTYAGLALDRYLSVLEMPNPMHRLWSDGRWNKLTLAHGCYWRKCSFCDVSLDYIGRYDPAPADLLVDRIEALIRETGTTGFHFVDEAAPPALLKQLAERLLARGVSVTWWGNIRFEKTFTPGLARLLARSGCVAVSGGLEVASDRLLKLMSKGVTVEQVARVTRAFADAGVLVHAYLMYGFPTQTEQETVDALERVRQLFAAGCIQSAYWHRFSATVHSPIGREPARYGIRLKPPVPGAFARNDLAFSDPVGTDHDRLGAGLRRALYNYMHGAGLNQDVRAWFGGKGPRAKVSRTLIAKAIAL